MAMKKEKMKELIDGKLSRHYGVSADEANREQVYQAVVMTIRDLLHEKYKAFKEEVSKKQGETALLFVYGIFGRKIFTE